MKKLLISFLLGLTVFFSFAPYLSPVKAESTWYNQGFQEWFGKVNDPNNPNEIFGERYTAAQVQWIIYGLFNFLIDSVTGPQNTPVIQCLISNITDVASCKDLISALLTTNTQGQPTAAAKEIPKQNLWSLVFATNRPISGISYVKERLRKLSLVTVVQAQSVGTGFNALRPVQGMWTAFRNISFGLFVVVAIIFAFMIMFRVKLSPQTVISVQSALPKIIIALVLVTFSYAIAGFLIDLMYVVIGFVSLIGSQMGWGSPATVFNILTVGQPVVATINFGVLGLLVVYLAAFCIILILLLLINIGAIGTVIAGVATAILLTSAVGPILLIVAMVAAVIMIVVVLWMMIKIIWGLLKAFANVLLLTILAPIQLTLGTFIPSLSFGSWVKNYISNLGVFVVTGVLILFSYQFLTQGLTLGLSTFGFGSGMDPGIALTNFIFGSSAGGALLGPVAGGSVAAWPPLLGGGGNAGVGLLFVIVSFVIFTLIPKANDIIQGFITGKPFAYGSAIGEAMAPFGLAAGYASSTMSRKGELPIPVSNWYTSLTGKTAPTGSPTIHAIGDVLQNLTRKH